MASKISQTKILDDTIYKEKEKDMHLHNIRTILLHSNATPINGHGATGYICCFCEDKYLDASKLKSHTIDKHNNMDISNFMKDSTMATYVVKLDITTLQCGICYKHINTLELLMDHLKNEHTKKIYSGINNHILPFKFDGDALRCVVCSNKFDHFKLLQSHMSVHYSNYVCKTCNSPFINRRTLLNHNARHKQGEFSCCYCTKVFDTQTKKSVHEKFVHLADNKRNKCPYCSEKFTSYSNRNTHMVEAHGVKPLILKCMACDKTFSKRDRLWKHTKRDHLLERRYECDHCDMKFYGKKELAVHMLKHTGVKAFRCEICFKSFGRKHTLKEHVRIHENDRRFKCENCGQAFVQKCSWKSHMRSKHGEIV